MSLGDDLLRYIHRELELTTSKSALCVLLRTEDLDGMLVDVTGRGFKGLMPDVDHMGCTESGITRDVNPVRSTVERPVDRSAVHVEEQGICEQWMPYLVCYALARRECWDRPSAVAHTLVGCGHNDQPKKGDYPYLWPRSARPNTSGFNPGTSREGKGEPAGIPFRRLYDETLPVAVSAN